MTGKFERKLLAFTLASLVSFCSFAAARAEYPERPVRIVVPVAPGGGVDVMARLLAQQLQERLHEHSWSRTGRAPEASSAANPSLRPLADGYDAPVHADEPVALGRGQQKPALRSAKDFSPIINVAISPYALVVNPSVPAHSLKEFIAYAKANPGKLSYGSAGVGSASHLAAELLKSKAGIEMVHVPNKGMNPALIDLMGGQVQVAVRQRPRPDLGRNRGSRAADRDGGDEAFGFDAGPADDGRVRTAGLCGRQLGGPARARRPRSEDRRTNCTTRSSPSWLRRR